MLDDTCRPENAGAARTVDGVHVLVSDSRSPEAVRRVADALTVTTPAGLAAFQRGTADVPATALLSGCNAAEEPIIIDGTQDRIRWVVGFATPPGDAAATCSAFVVDGHPESAMSGRYAAPPA